MKKFLVLSLAVMMMLSCAFVGNAEMQDSTGGGVTIVRDDFDSVDENKIVGDDKTLVSAENGILTLNGTGAAYALPEFQTPTRSWTMTFRFKYSGEAGIGVEALANANQRIRCNIYPKSKSVNYVGGAISNVSHSENTWYNYVIEVVPTANNASKVTYYRKTDSQQTFEKIAEVLTNQNTGGTKGIVLQSLDGSVVYVDYISVASDTYAEEDIVSANKNVLYENDYADEEDGIKVIGAETVQTAFKASGAWAVKVRFMYTDSTKQPCFEIHDGSKRMKLNVNNDLLMYAIDGNVGANIALKHFTNTWYEYLVTVDEKGYADYYRKTGDETVYTKVLSNELLTGGGTSNAVKIGGESTQVDYISVFTQAYSEEEILGTDVNYLYEKNYINDPDFMGPMNISGNSGILKSDFYRVGDYAVHFRYKMSTGGATLEVNGGRQRIKAGVYDNCLGYDSGVNTYTTAVLTHENNKYYEYIADYSAANSKVTYYRKAEGESNYTKVAAADYTGAFEGAKNQIKIGGQGYIDFIYVTSKKYNGSGIIGDANITSLYEKNMSVTAEAAAAAQVDYIAYPYVINVKFTMNDALYAMEYVDAGGYRTKLEVYPNAFMTNSNISFNADSAVSGSVFEYMIKVNENKVAEYYRKADNGSYDKVYEDSCVPGKTAGLTVRTASGAAEALNIEYLRVYTSGDEKVTVKSKECKIENGTASGSAQVYYNSADADKKAQASVILAVYDSEGALKDISVSNAEISGHSGAVEAAAQNIVTKNYADGDEAKIFVWDSLNSIRPY